MDDKLFVIAIGGTGMRCLESFVHLCAIGMFDNQEIDVLTLDTDSSNGNKDRAETLIGLYNEVKRDGENEIGIRENTFFSAKVNLYKFTTDYAASDRNSYQNLAKLGNDADDADLAALFLDDNVCSFNLEHGYRAQTHLGSMLMYHGIMEAMRNYVQDKGAHPEAQALFEFITKIAKASDKARVFVFGSIFGGTGASSLPIIPKALSDAAALDGQLAIDVKKVKFGSTLLSQYFSFGAPDQKERESEKVIATSELFPLNCQAALQFYQSDPTVRSCYRRFYHIGWPSTASLDLSDGTSKVKTGGNQQKNDCHVVELLCACAAHDFFYAPSDDLSNPAASYLYRCVEHDGNGFKFEGNTFFDEPKGDVFANKLGMFLSLAHIVMGRSKAAWGEAGSKNFVSFLSNQKITRYNTLTDEQLKSIDNYLQQFSYKYSVSDKKMIFGWIYQIYNSLQPGGRFIFNNNAFEQTPERLKTIDPGSLFDDAKHVWTSKGLFGSTADKHIDTLADILKDASCMPSQSQYGNLKEQFLAHLYNGLAKAQHAFN